MPEYDDRTTSTASTDTRTLLNKTSSAATATWTLSTASIQHTYFLTILHRMKIEDTGFYKDISYKTFIHIRTIYNELLSDIYTVNSSIFCIITNNFTDLVITRPSPPRSTILYIFNSSIPFFRINITQRL